MKIPAMANRVSFCGIGRVSDKVALAMWAPNATPEDEEKSLHNLEQLLGNAIIELQGATDTRELQIENFFCKKDPTNEFIACVKRQSDDFKDELAKQLLDDLLKLVPAKKVASQAQLGLQGELVEQLKLTVHLFETLSSLVPSLYFSAVGRVRDNVALACWCAEGGKVEDHLRTEFENYIRTITFTLGPGERLKMEWRNMSAYCHMSEQSECVTMVAGSVDRVNDEVCFEFLEKLTLEVPMAKVNHQERMGFQGPMSTHMKFLVSQYESLRAVGTRYIQGPTITFVGIGRVSDGATLAAWSVDPLKDYQERILSEFEATFPIVQNLSPGSKREVQLAVGTATYQMGPRGDFVMCVVSEDPKFQKSAGEFLSSIAREVSANKVVHSTELGLQQSLSPAVKFTVKRYEAVYEVNGMGTYGQQAKQSTVHSLLKKDAMADEEALYRSNFRNLVLIAIGLVLVVLVGVADLITDGFAFGQPRPKEEMPVEEEAPTEPPAEEPATEPPAEEPAPEGDLSQASNSIVQPLQMTSVQAVQAAQAFNRRGWTHQQSMRSRQVQENPMAAAGMTHNLRGIFASTRLRMLQ